MHMAENMAQKLESCLQIPLQLGSCLMLTNFTSLSVNWDSTVVIPAVMYFCEEFGRCMINE